MNTGGLFYIINNSITGYQALSQCFTCNCIVYNSSRASFAVFWPEGFANRGDDPCLLFGVVLFLGAGARLFIGEGCLLELPFSLDEMIYFLTGRLVEKGWCCQQNGRSQELADSKCCHEIQQMMSLV